MGFKESYSTLLKLSKKKKCIFIGIAVAFIFYVLNVFLSNFRDLVSIINTKGFFKMLEIFPLFMINYAHFFTYKFFIGLIILSLLFGILISLIYHKTKMLKDHSGRRGFLTTLGIFFGIIAPGCSACGIGFLSVIGIGGAIVSFLPWKGFELFLISIALISFSVYKISGDIDKGIVCKIPVKNFKNKQP